MLFRQCITRWVKDGKRVPPRTPGAKKVRSKSKKWYGKVNGQPVPLHSNKAVALQRLAELRRVADLDEHEQQRVHRDRPLAEHIEDYERRLVAKENTPRYVSLVVSRLRTVFDGIGARTPADLDQARVEEWLVALRADRQVAGLDPEKLAWTPREVQAMLGVSLQSIRAAIKRHQLAASGHGKRRTYPRETVEELLRLAGRGASAQTAAHYARTLRSFGLWLARRTGHNPLAHLPIAGVQAEARHARRELSAEELRHLLITTRTSPRSFRGLSGEARYHLYLAACATGFRAAALAGLTPEAFDLEAGIVVLAARRNKSRKVRRQPLPADVVAELRVYLERRPSGLPVWPGRWAQDFKGAEMLRLDLEAAGIPYIVEGPDGPLFADFHALRHSYITALGRGGVDLRTAQELAGHSSPVLTARYSHRWQQDLAAAVEQLPRLVTPMVTTENADECQQTSTNDKRYPSAG